MYNLCAYPKRAAFLRSTQPSNPQPMPHSPANEQPELDENPALDDLSAWEKRVGILRLVIWDHFYADHPGPVSQKEMTRAVLCAAGVILRGDDIPLFHGFDIQANASKAASVARKTSLLLLEQMDMVLDIIGLTQPSPNRSRSAELFISTLLDLVTHLELYVPQFIRPEELMQNALETLLLLSSELREDQGALFKLLRNPAGMEPDIEQIIETLNAWM